MLLLHWRRTVLWPLFALSLACLWLLHAQPAYAQPPTCGDIINDVENAFVPAACLAFPVGNACLAARRVDATLRATQPFSAPGNKTALRNISRLNTRPLKGAAVLLGGSNANPVKVLIFGDTATSPSTNQPNTVFTLRTTNGQPTCERTRSGMILQTPDGQNGALVVNGVTINLGSTAYVVPGADLLFDQDPRTDRRQGSRNRNAPLCSGFDSDCGFGDDSCSEDDRLVYGPFCREDTYPYIESGLYRITLYGEGEVQAGATDYNITFDYEMMGTQRLTLPGGYTFCWDGLQDGGTGFETIVQARSTGAYVDHITLEYLGRDCSLRGADNPAAGMGNGEMGVLTVYNLEGGVGVELPDGQEGGPGQGQRLRIYYDGNEPVAMDDFATDAPYVLGSDLAQWATGATGSGLPDIRITGATTDTATPRDPAVSVTADVLYDGDTPYALRIEAQAYDPDVGDENGDGIDRVYFSIRDEEDNLIWDNDEDTPAYCAFGGESPCEASISSESYGPGDYRVTATAYSVSGREASATADFTLPDTEQEEPVVSLDAEVLYEGDFPYALRIEAQAYDPNVGSSNGDGIDHVYFTIRNASGESVYENDEGSAAYCAFGGDSPCEQPISPEVIDAGDYEVTATAYTDAGAEASASASFSINWDSSVDSGAPPTEVPSTEEPPTDSTPPFFSSITSKAAGGSYCFGNSLTFGVDVNDDTSVEDVTFWWRVYDSGEAPPPFELYGRGSGNGYFEASLSDLFADYVDVYFTATDNSGNEGSTGVTTVTGTDCSVE